MERLNDILVNLLKTDSRYFTEEGEILKNAVYEDAMKMDSSLIKLLLSDDTCKARFFTEVDGVLVFDKVGFGWVINNRQFLPDSYTRFKNKIGLTDSNGDFISSSNDVVLSFPYKDCVLEGGQSKEDQKREEVFYNETLAPEEVDRLLYPKVFTGAKRYTKDGVEENITFNENDNLIIKGNNLLAIASLLKKYEGKVKLIYIDPPFNTGGDSFMYNDKFNHSTWLTFIKNRLMIAKKLLAPDGSIFVHLDWNEVHYCKILMDELFGRECFRNEVIWCYTGPGSPKMSQLNRKHDNILWYSKNPTSWTFNGDKVRMQSEVHAGGFNGEMTTAISNDYAAQGKIPEDWWQLFHTLDDLKEEFEKLNEEAQQTGMGDWLKYAVASRIRVDGLNRTGYLTEKPYKLMERLIKMATNEGDLILDFFAGSGTTGYVANYLNRKFILVEQLDSTYNILSQRFSKIKHVEVELAKLNQTFVEAIQSAENDEQLASVWSEMRESGFISSYVNPKDINNEAEDFNALSFEDKKRLFIAILDKNMLYVNYCDIDDESYSISDKDKAFTHSFYKES